MDSMKSSQISCFQELYDVINKDCDSSITHKELEIVLNALGIKAYESQIQDMINEADTDGNGTLDLREFVDGLCRKMNQCDLDELNDAFFVIDKDHNGFISPAELRSTYIALGMKISEEEIEEMIREADLDQDGVITMDEFIIMMSCR